MIFKRCPICKESKPLSEYDFYFSKQRNKHRPQNYCKSCQKPKKNELSKEYYKKNTQARKNYSKRYGSANKEIVKQKKQVFKVRYVQELKDCYLVDYIKKKTDLTTKQIRETEGLIEVFRAKLKLFRKIKSIKNEKQIE